MLLNSMPVAKKFTHNDIGNIITQDNNKKIL